MKQVLAQSLCAAALTCGVAQAQNFANLNFESAKVVIIGTNALSPYMAASNALAGWSAYDGPSPLSRISYNPNPAGGSTLVFLVGSNREVLSGNFSVGLGANASISQTGIIPDDAESLLFEAFFIGGSSTMSVSLDGQNLAYSIISSSPNYDLYGANISAFAGQDETLTFSATEGAEILDDIQFSTMTIPEPGELALLASGALVFCMPRRWRLDARQDQQKHDRSVVQSAHLQRELLSGNRSGSECRHRKYGEGFGFNE